MPVDHIGKQGYVYNHDVLGIVRRVNRFIAELLKSASGGVSYLNSHDVARLRSYLAASTAYLTWVKSQPQLDLPETHPQQYEVPEAPTAVDLENDDITDIVNLWTKMRDELVNSQSARLPSSLVHHDVVRVEAILEKIVQFLAYVEQTSPLDLPESSPRAEMHPGGRTGV